MATEDLTALPSPAYGVVPAKGPTARLVGVLFIVATVTSIIGGSLLLPLDDPDYLVGAQPASQGKRRQVGQCSAMSP